MGEINDIQDNLEIWLYKNFQETSCEDQILVLMEEVGELCHAVIKTKQKIRGYDEVNSIHEIKDSVGDIFISLCNFCNARGLNITDCIYLAYNNVINRDWQKNPDDGI